VVACVNDVFFKFFCSNTTSISFVHSFLLSSFWWFVHGETTFLFWSLLVKKSPHQQQQTNNIKMSSCIFGNLHSTYIRWMFLTKLGIILNSDDFNNIGDHSKLSTFRLWLPVSVIFFTFSCSNTTSISFVHSFILSSFRWFIHGGITFLFWSLLGTRTPTTNTNTQHSDVFLYIRKTTFYSSFMDVFNNIGDHSKLKTIRLWLPVSMMSF
jgi:hypothetical protein